MVIVGNNYSKFSAVKDQQLSVEECGLKILIPAGVITTVDASYEITAYGLWGDKFEFPKNTKLISGVCYISVCSSSQLNKPVTVQLEHCAIVTNEKQAEYFSFVVSKSGPPFKFEYLPGGLFCPGSQYGTIHLKKFSLLAIVLCAVVGSASMFNPGVVLGGAVGVAVGVATFGLGGLVVGGAVGGTLGHLFATSKYILIIYACLE